MENEDKEILDSSNQDVDTSADNELNDTLTGEDDQRYLNQKIRAEKAEQAKKLAEEKAKLLEQELAKKRNDNNPHLPDELKLIARGLSDEAIEQAKIIAKGKDISLQEAIKDPLFVLYQEKEREDKRKADAKLGASKGSGESEEESEIKPDMSRDEHIKVFKKRLGQ